MNWTLVNLVTVSHRGVARWGRGGGLRGLDPPRNLADQYTLFKPVGADYAPHTTASPPGLKKLSTSLSQALARLHQDHRTNIGKLTKTTPFAAPVPPETSTSPTASADQQI